MATTITATPGPNRPVLDLDAGTTLPRAVRVALGTLLVAAVALLAVAAGPGEDPPADASAGIRPPCVSVPAVTAWQAAARPDARSAVEGPHATLPTIATLNPEAVPRPAQLTGSSQ